MKDIAKIKLLALDLDGTTLRSDVTLSKKVKKSLIRAYESGINIVAASGRPYATMPREVLDLDGVNYAITSNGAAVYDNNKNRIKSYLLDENEIKKILDITKGHDLIFEAFINGYTYTDKSYAENPEKYGCPKAYVDYVKSSHAFIDDMPKFIFEHRNELDCIEFATQNKELRNDLRTKIADNTKNTFITSSSDAFVEFSAKQATKAKALEYVSSIFGIESNNTSACGNADNDALMIKWAGLGCAVRNATQLCIDYADIIVPQNDDDGVAKLIEYIIEHNSKFD